MANDCARWSGTGLRVIRGSVRLELRVRIHVACSRIEVSPIMAVAGPRMGSSFFFSLRAAEKTRSSETFGAFGKKWLFLRKRWRTPAVDFWQRGDLELRHQSGWQDSPLAPGSARGLDRRAGPRGRQSRWRAEKQWRQQKRQRSSPAPKALGSTCEGNEPS